MVALASSGLFWPPQSLLVVCTSSGTGRGRRCIHKRSPLVARIQRRNCVFRWFLMVFWLGQLPGSSLAVPRPSNLASEPVSQSKNALNLASQPVSQSKNALNLASQPVSQSSNAVNPTVSQSASQPLSQSASHRPGAPW